MEPEIRSRYEVKLDKYTKTLNIEANVMERMVRRNFIPAINAYATKIAKGINIVREAMPDAELAEQQEQLQVILYGLKKTNHAFENLKAVHAQAEGIADDNQAQADFYASTVVPAMESLRAEIDALEPVVDHGYWPVPTYNDILFYV